MSGRDNELWQQSWRDRKLDFHQKVVNPHLVRFWERLALPAESAIFVPLCGKSLDIVWLAAQGYRVIGVELSPLAVRAFFKENRMQASRRPMGRFTCWENGRISILCGDFFELSAANLGDIAAVFDRASLTALATDIRAAYLGHLRRIVPAACKIMLLTTEEPEEGESLDQEFAAAEEVSTLYREHFDMDLAHVESFFEADPDSATGGQVRVEHKVYLLTPKQSQQGGTAE
ncbi:MAG: thiopurine S-methyltransferase [Rhodocyclales bacterium GT-UBC]|nr:MAG: thiopurine S-methyltransferase [Rhodocyclales bacterium GT-UBC]